MGSPVENKKCGYVAASSGAVNGVDKTKEFLNKCTPKFVYNIVPQDFLKFNDNRSMLNNGSVNSAYSNLPRQKDGTVDRKRVAAARDVAVNYITQKNNAASNKMNYGVYRENLDSAKPLTFVFGPEVADVLERKANVKINARFGMNDLSYKLSSSMSNSWFKDAINNMAVKPAHVIRGNIESQNKSLQDLSQIDISTDEGMMQMLEQYRKITGTNFSSQDIERADSCMTGKIAANGHDKLYSETRAFGLLENYTDATKNKTATDGTFTAARNTSAAIVAKIPHPVTKIISLAMPTVMLANDKLTEGRDDSEIINMDNLTYKNYVEVVAQGAVEGVFAQFNFGLGKLGQKLGIFRPTAEGGARAGVKGFASKLVGYSVKAVTPNWEDKSNLLEFVIPGQHLARSIWGKIFG